MTRSRLYKVAKQAVLHAGSYAYHGRKLRKRDMRRLWIQRINAAARMNGMSYSVFMNKIHKNNVELNRKVLADLAMNEPKAFEAIVKSLK